MTPQLWYLHGYLIQYLNRELAVVSCVKFHVHIVFFISNQVAKDWSWDLGQNLSKCKSTGQPGSKFGIFSNRGLNL